MIHEKAHKPCGCHNLDPGRLIQCRESMFVCDELLVFEHFRKYDEALDYHEKALVLCPKNPSTLSAIGYVHTLKGNSAQAVDYFHKV